MPLERKSVVAVLNPATLAVLSVLALDITQDNAANFGTGISGCGTGYLCITGTFNPAVVIGGTTLTNSGVGNDNDGFIARIARP